MLELQPHMGHQDQDGEKVGQMSFFFLSQRLLRTEKSKNSKTFKSYYLILALAVLKITRRTTGARGYKFELFQRIS